jgi:hypothetical protein
VTPVTQMITPPATVAQTPTMVEGRLKKRRIPTRVRAVPEDWMTTGGNPSSVAHELQLDLDEMPCRASGHLEKSQESRLLVGRPALRNLAERGIVGASRLPPPSLPTVEAGQWRNEGEHGRTRRSGHRGRRQRRRR